MRKSHRIPRFFYHVTRGENLDDILTTGMVPGEGVPLLGEVEFPDVLWLDSSLKNLANWISQGRLKDIVLLRIDSQFLDKSGFAKSGFSILGRKTWWKYQGEIPPEAIRVISTDAKRYARERVRR